ncbi:unnamed protein product, partial [Owenia fusiformis]
NVQLPVVGLPQFSSLSDVFMNIYGILSSYIVRTRPHLYRLYSKNSKSHPTRRLQELLISMKKSEEKKSETAALKNISLKHVNYKKKRGAFPPPSHIELLVLGNGTRGNPRSLLVITPHTRYLFNCGESTQRICYEYKNLKVSRIEHAFITYKSWENLGGLLGMCLSLADMKVPNFTFHGPPDVEKIITESRGFAPIAHMDIVKKELRHGPFTDPGLHVQYVPIYCEDSQINTCSEQKQKEQTISTKADHEIEIKADSLQGKEQSSSNSVKCEDEVVTVSRGKDHQSDVTEVVDVTTDSDVGGKDDQSLKDMRDVTVAYICTPHQKQRSVDVDKCMQLNFPMGPHIRDLKDGKTVTLPDGRVIHPDDILSPDSPSVPFIVLECPKEDFLDAFLKNEDLKKYQIGGDVAAAVVVHMSPSRIVQHPKYQQFMNSFPKSTQHLLLDGSGTEVSGIGVYKLQSLLNMMDERIFPLLPHQCDISTASSTKLNSTDNVTVGDCGHRYHIRPHTGFDRDCCPVIENEVYKQEVRDQPGFDALFNKTLSLLGAHPRDTTINREYPEIVFLGTGSAVPNKARNVSAILVHMSKEQTILLDSGEGTAGQIYRHYANKANSVLRRLSCLYVSHMHADHHLGLITLVKARKEAFKEKNKDVTPLLIVGPWNLRRWFNSVHYNIEHLKWDVKVLPLQEMVEGSDAYNQDTRMQLQQLLNLEKFETTEVVHCRNAFGSSFTHKDGWKLCYSGDTMPCESLVDIGKECDILIHEATMEDDLVKEAKFKRHSTTSQAIDIGRKMKAKFTILTHFSQRYAKIPLFSEKFSEHVGIAFDNMKVTPNDLTVLPHFKSALTGIFAEHVEEMEEKKAKRQVKRERDAAIFEIQREAKILKTQKDIAVTKIATDNKSVDIKANANKNVTEHFKK